MGSLTFTINDASTGGNNPQVQVTITENADGTLTFNVVQLVSPQGGFVGDLRGFFFDLGNEGLKDSLTMSSTTAPTGPLRVGNDSIVDLGNGATMSGLTNADGLKTSKTAGAEQNGFDAGFEIGSAGIGSDDVRSLSFTLGTTNGAALSLADFANVDFGVRLTSVGPVDAQGNFTGAREGSSKIAERTFTPSLDAKDATLDATLEDTTASGSLFANATTGTGTTKEVTSFTLNGTTYTFSANAASHTVPLVGTHGATITVHADGRYVIDAKDADALSLGEQVPASLTYTLRETYYEANGTVAGSVMETATLGLSIKGVKDGPTIVAEGTDAAGAVKEAPEGAEGGARSDAGAIAFSDVDLKDTHSAELAANGTNYLGTFNLGTLDQGTDTVGWSFSVVDGVLDFLSEGEEITQTYDVTVTDNNGAKATQTVTVTITGTNDGRDAADDTYAPVRSDISNKAFGTVLSNDTDVDHLDVLSVSAINGVGFGTNGVETITLASGGKVTIKADGTFSYDASGLTTTLYEGHSRTETFQYTVSDGNGGFDTASVSFRVEGVGQLADVPPPPPPPAVVAADSFPLWPQDISHFTLYFQPNLGGDVAHSQRNVTTPADGVYTVKIETPETFPDDLDVMLPQILANLRNNDPGNNSGTPDPYPYINADTVLLGVAIKGGRTPETYYAVAGNTNGTAPDPVPTGTLVLDNDLAPEGYPWAHTWLLT